MLKAFHIRVDSGEYWNDMDNISMALVQGWHTQIKKWFNFFHSIKFDNESSMLSGQKAWNTIAITGEFSRAPPDNCYLLLYFWPLSSYIVISYYIVGH